MKLGKQWARGFTLVEMLVVILIVSIVLAVMISVLGSSFEILRTGETKAQLMSDARTALDYVCRDIDSAADIPLAKDRDLNGWRDETPQDANRTPPDVGYPYQDDGDYAIWRIAWPDQNNLPVVAASYFLSEAWSDRILLSHEAKQYGSGVGLLSPNYANSKELISGGRSDYAEFTTLFRLALPVAPLDPAAGDPASMPYYLQPPDRVFLGSVPLGRIYGYPDVVAAGPHKETAALMEDQFLYFQGSAEPHRSGRIPVATNITRIKFEYLHEVPVYTSRVLNGNVELAYQNLDDGSINWRSPFWAADDVYEDEVPIVSRWELRQIDVAFDRDYVDPGTGSINAGTYWMLADEYPEGLDPNKLSGDDSGTDRGTHVGLGAATMHSDSHTGWNCSAFYNTSTSPGSAADNAPIDRLAYVTDSLSNGVQISGGIAALRPDMAMQGQGYLSYAEDPTGIGDFGDADGIPDGDGIPDDPVPGWWLPFLRAVRVTIVATPQQVIRARLERSGKEGKLGTTVYYRLDSPVPYSDPERTMPLYNQKQDYLGSGRDLVVSKTVPVSYADRADLLWDPRAATIGDTLLRRVEINYLRALIKLASDPTEPGEAILARTPSDKLTEQGGSNP
jgi:prepilin-type N-terminal cleavage/methylation domain-containing protein